MNRPLMFTNNDFIVEQLKTEVWKKYKEVRNCDFQGWYEGLSPIEKQLGMLNLMKYRK